MKMRSNSLDLAESRVLSPESPAKEAAKDVARFRWVQLWICGGIVLALVLLVSSISNYRAVSSALIMDHLRRELRTEAGQIEEQAREGSVRTSRELGVILKQALTGAAGRIAWIQVVNGDGVTLSGTGLPEGQVFSAEETRTHLRGRQPLLKTIKSGNRSLLVERLPFRFSAGMPQRRSMNSRSGPPNSIEIAEFWDDTNVVLTSVRWHLFINSSAALLLLFALALIGSRFRLYLRGNECPQQIEIARGVQRDLLPSSKCSIDRFEIAGDYTPAFGISGDFYDAFSVPGDCAAFVLGDVAGKGVPAAVLTGVLHGAVRSASWTDSAEHHCAATRSISDLLCERAASNRFATMFWSYFDPGTGLLRFINAGHCPPLLINRGNRGPLARLQTGGPVLGLLRGAQFEQGSVRLDSGDCLILYSDGIVEAMNARGEEFGEDRLAAVVRENAGTRADEIRDAILNAVDTFMGEAAAHDDRTLVVAAYQGCTSRRDAAESGDRLTKRVSLLTGAAFSPAAG